MIQEDNKQKKKIYKVYITDKSSASKDPQESWTINKNDGQNNIVPNNAKAVERVHWGQTFQTAYNNLLTADTKKEIGKKENTIVLARR